MRIWCAVSEGLLLLLQGMKRCLLAIFFFGCFVQTTEAQTASHYQLSVFGTRNGLLSPKIYTLIQTSDRYLWIGTEIGASRYNGYNFQNLQYTSAQEQLGKIVAISEDSAGGVWLGGEGGLFYYLNGEVSRCVFVKNYIAAIESLTTDKNGTLWIGEMHGLYRLTAAEIKAWKKEKASLDLRLFGGIDKRIICLDTDAGGNVYFGSFEGVFSLPAGARQAKITWQNATEANLVHFITALSPDSVFFNQYDGESSSLLNGSVKQYHEKTNVGQRFFKKDGAVFRLTTSTVERFGPGGFLPFIFFGQQTNFAFDAICDAENNIWLGTWEGLFKFRYTPFAIYHRTETAHPETFSFLEAADGRLLFGGNRGTIAYKKEEQIIPVTDIQPVFRMAEVLAMFQHSDGSYWFGSGYEGITHLRNGQQTNFSEGNGLPDNHSNTFYKVDDHTVFVCSEKGVIVLDPSANNALKTHYDFAKAYNRRPKLLGVFEPEKGNFFFYSNGGLFRLNKMQLQQETIKGMPAQNLYITRIQTDSKGRVWIATQGKGLLQCNYTNGSLTLNRQYTKKDGLPSDELLSLLVDKKDRLWIADYTSLSLLQENNNHSYFINFTDQDGLPQDYYQHLHLVSQKNGTVWALTSMNLFSFHPDSVWLNTVSPRLSFDSIVAEKGEGRLAAGLSANVQLDHNNNNLSFFYTAVCLSNPAKIKYAYRLLPGDTSWIETAERQLHLSSLNPGAYTVQIKAANNSGFWSAPISYSFQIKPPFWNAWWFYLLLGVPVLLLIYWMFRRRIKAVNDKAATRQQLTELESKALRAQMNPHFIFNSLNAIQELVVTQNIEAAYDYLSKFSKLLRLVLNHSEKSLIPLADEVSMLELYLELESLRFRQSFSYQINIDKALDAETALVPPLLLQPFIENAVWHGLMLKEGEKKLSLTIRSELGKIVCLIEDNGIGRKKSAEIKAQKLGARHFESKGLKLSQHRIRLLESEGKKATIEIKDLYTNEQPTGTRVSIYLPLTYN